MPEPPRLILKDSTRLFRGRGIAAVLGTGLATIQLSQVRRGRLFCKNRFCASFMCDHIPPSARNWPCRLDERAHIRTFVLFYRIGCDPAQVDRGRKERFYYWVGWDVPVSGGFRLRISARGMLSPESPMALARPRKRMKMAGCRVLGWQQAPALRGSPTPGPVSGYGACFRPPERRAGRLSRIGVRDMLS